MTDYVGAASMAGSTMSKGALNRRSILKAATGIGGLLLADPLLAVASTTSFDITQAPFSVDQSGGNDCSAGIQAALDAISSIGAGTLVVPAGTYKVTSPLTCTGSLTIRGEGQASSVFVICHKQAALSVACASWAGSVTIRDVGFSPVPGDGGAAGTALALSFPAVNSGWQRLSIQDVDLGVAKAGYTSFMTGLALVNCWRGNVRNLNMHSNIGGVLGSAFVTLSGKSVDNRFANCSVDGIDFGFLLSAYAEGLHITDSVIIATTAISTGSALYSGNGSDTPCINLLGLYISGCEFNCWGVTADLRYVTTGWISDTHFGCNVPRTPAMSILGCSDMQVANCSFTGQLGTASPAYDIGILIGSAGSWPSNGISISGPTFTTLAVGVQFGPGTYNSSATGIRMMVPGEGSLVNYPGYVGAVPLRAVYDLSGNSTNTGQWIASVGGATAPPSKIRYTYPGAP